MPDGGRPPGLAGSAAWLIVKLRYAVVAFWILAAVVMTVKLPAVGEAQAGALGDLVPHDAEALQAELRSSELFAFPLLSRTLVVQRDPDGLSAIAQVDALWRAVLLNRDQLAGLERVAGAFVVSNTLGQPPFSKEASTTALTYLLFAPAVDQGDRSILAQRLIDRVQPEQDGYVGATGALAARAEQAEAIEEALPAVEIATLLLVALVVGLHFRALGAPLATLAAVALAYLISIRAIAGIGKEAGFSVPSEVEPVVIVLLFGVVTDYSIFFLSRIRRRLADGENPHAATIAGTAELLPIIFTAGITVTAAAASLVVAQLGFFQAFGPGMALSLLVGLLVAITFVPALLSIGGRWLFWPRRPGVEVPAGEAAEETPTERSGRPARHRAVELAAARPVATIAVCGAVLLAAASGLAQVELGNPLIRGLPPDSPPREAYVQASYGFAPGILSPTVIVVEGRGIASERSALAALGRLLEEQPGVAEVVGPGDQPSSRVFGGVLSKTGDAARYFVVLNADPLGAKAIATLSRLRAKMPRLLPGAGLSSASASYAGDTALVSETIDEAVGDIGRVTPVALLVVFLIMVVFLRALVAPLYLLAASVLALVAALGLTAYVFQGLAGQEGLAYFVPFAAAVLLLSLGSDYNVFLTGRIWQEAGRRPLREAVRVAGARAATPITIAGIVLAGSFALLFLVPIRPFQQLGFAMAAGLLIDAFLVRTLLVPALIVLVGPRSGWPGRRLRGVEAVTARRSVNGEDGASPAGAVMSTWSLWHRRRLASANREAPNMTRAAAGKASLRERATGALDAARRSFGFLTGVAMLAGLVAGFALPSIDAALDVALPVFDFAGQDVARSLLQTVATATVSVAGLSFSVTVVAFTLASSQLSPRVLRTFSADRLSQVTLACFLGTFIYCLAVLVRLGSAADGRPVPNLSVTLALLLAFVAFVMFAAFIAHIVQMLQPSSIIEDIGKTGRAALERPYPGQMGTEPKDATVAERDVLGRCPAGPGVPVHARSEGYLTMVRGIEMLSAGAESDGLVVQRVRIGDYLTLGTPLADVWCAEDDDRERLVEAVQNAFVLGSQRTPVQDAAFPIRQLADIALKGLSPGINDPTTAENAMDALSSLLVRFAASRKPSPMRADEDGTVRFVALAVELDDLVRLGFEQVRVFAAPYPVFARRLLTLLKHIEDAARRGGVRCFEPARQAALIAEGPDGEVPTHADVEGVRAEHARHWAPSRE